MSALGLRTPFGFMALVLLGAMVTVIACAGEIKATDPDTPPTVKVEAAAGSKYQIDKDRQIFEGIRDDSRILAEVENHEEYLSYNEVVMFANQFPLAELEENARKDVTYKDLMSRFRADYKLDLIALEGRLGRLRKLEPNKQLISNGITVLYEAWIFPKDTNEAVCLLLTQVPEGIQPALTYTPAPRVKFAGYYFKVMQYEMTMKDSKDPSRGKLGRAPFLIGKSLTLLPEPLFTPGERWRATFLPILLAVIGGISALGFALAWWLRRGDQHVKTLMANRAEHNPFPS